MKIAIASSGLGHVQRGIEAWAAASATALARYNAGRMVHSAWRKEQGAGGAPGFVHQELNYAEVSATLREDGGNRSAVNSKQLVVTLFCGAGLEDGGRKTVNSKQYSVNGSKVCREKEPANQRIDEPTNCRMVSLRCLKRGSFLARMFARIAPDFAWRWGWKSPYGIEQYTFAKAMIRELKARPVDIVHTQDVVVASMLEKARKNGVITAKTILAHGTEEEMDTLAQFNYLQELSPPYAKRHGERKGLFMIPNFVDTDVFRPENPECLAQSTQSSAAIGKEAKMPQGLQAEPEAHAVLSSREEKEGGKDCLSQSSQRTQREETTHDFPRMESFGRVAAGGDPEGFSDQNWQLNNSDHNRESLRSQRALREKYGIPEEAFVIGSVGAVQKWHKRIDFLIREFGALLAERGDDLIIGKFDDSANIQKNGGRNHAETNERISKSSNQRLPFLLIAGARTADSDELVKMAEELAPGKVRFLFDLPREKMPDVYRCMDLYVHPAEKEIFGICLLEAMASGVPVIAHKYPVTEWILGVQHGAERMAHGAKDSLPCDTPVPEQSSVRGVAGCGICVDMTAEGCLREVIQNLTADTRRLAQMGENARKRVEEMFSSEAVIPQFVSMYSRVLHS